ncbi:UNVERIFIED_CONTAM: hypothetical protein FKN15_053387 [Acipenser sinensis]
MHAYFGMEWNESENTHPDSRLNLPVISPAEYEASATPAKAFRDILPEGIQKMIEEGSPSFVVEELKCMPMNDNLRDHKARCLWYLNQLIKLLFMKVIKHKSKGTRQHKQPQTAVISIQNVVSSSMKSKISSYVLALALHINDFQTDLTLLQRDMKLSENKMLEIAKAMGLKITKRSVSMSGGVSEDHKFGTLSAELLPLIKRAIAVLQVPWSTEGPGSLLREPSGVLASVQHGHLDAYYRSNQLLCSSSTASLLVCDSVTDPQHTAVEVAALLQKQAICMIDPLQLEERFYSRYFLVPKRDGGLRPILDLRQVNLYLRAKGFKMMTMQQLFQSIRPGDCGFSKCMDAILALLRFKGIRIHNYLDNWLIYAKSPAQADAVTELVNGHLQWLGLMGLLHMCSLQAWFNSRAFQPTLNRDHLSKGTLLVETEVQGRHHNSGGLYKPPGRPQVSLSPSRDLQAFALGVREPPLTAGSTPARGDKLGGGPPLKEDPGRGALCSPLLA